MSKFKVAEATMLLKQSLRLTYLLARLLTSSHRNCRYSIVCGPQ